jgi:hypothetical protein
MQKSKCKIFLKPQMDADKHGFINTFFEDADEVNVKVKLQSAKLFL